MAMTEGSWTYASGTTTSGTSIANMETLVDEIVALIQAADAGWSVATASTQYATATGVWARLTHSSGPALIIVGTLNTNGTGTQIDAANTWDGAAVGISTAGSRGRVWVAWQPTGVTAPSNDPSNASFFAAATDFRLVPLVVTSNWASNSRRLHVMSTSEGALAIVSQNTVADGTTSANLFIAASDLISQTVHSGDTYTAAMVNLTNTTTAATLTLATSLCAGQCLKASGAARVALNLFATSATNATTNVQAATAGGSGGIIAATVQAAAPYVTPPVWLARDNADVATAGVVNNNGVKGIVNPYAVRIVPTSTGSKQSLEGGDYIHWAGGFASGWKSTNVVA